MNVCLMKPKSDFVFLCPLPLSDWSDFILTTHSTLISFKHTCYIDFTWVRCWAGVSSVVRSSDAHSWSASRISAWIIRRWVLLIYINILWFSTKSWFSGLRILWSSCQISVTSLMSFSQPKVRHTFPNFTIRQISLFWYRFAKKRTQNSSFRSPKRRNEIATQKISMLSRETN